MTIANSIQRLRDGNAFWYGLADTPAGQMFVKVPFAVPTGGHESNWQEYIALRRAPAVGLPASEPYSIELDASLVADDDRDRNVLGLRQPVY